MTNWTVKDIREAVNSGATSATEIVAESLKRIAEKDGEIGAFLEVFNDDAMKAAVAVDARIKAGESLVLAGVPIAIKDNILVAGHIASAGSKMLEHYRASYTSTVVTRLQAAGAIIVGRTNMDEFAFGSSTESSAFHVTKNPADTTKIPGGTSGGSAAAVAAFMVPAALGSDTGGSVRQPACMCGVVGMKPTYGRVSRYGLIADGSSLDQIGPLATTVEDVALVLSVIEGRDEHDATSVALESATSAEALNLNLNGVRIGLPKEYFIDGMDEDVAARVHEAIDTLKKNGAEIVDISLPLAPYALPAFYIIQPAEASSNLARFDGMRYGDRGPGSLEESYRDARGAGLGAESKRRILLGTFILSAGYYDAYYKKAIAVRAAMRLEFDAKLSDLDVIVGPVSPIVAWPFGAKMEDPVSMYLADVFTVSANILGIPAISVPCGTAHGLPVGLQILGKSFDDAKVLSVAAAFEAVR